MVDYSLNNFTDNICNTDDIEWLKKVIEKNAELALEFKIEKKDIEGFCTKDSTIKIDINF